MPDPRALRGMTVCDLGARAVACRAARLIVLRMSVAQLGT
jgi:hypothetical protein